MKQEFVLNFFEQLTQKILNTDHHCKFIAYLETNETFLTISPLQIFAYECEIYSIAGKVIGKGATYLLAYFEAIKEIKK